METYLKLSLQTAGKDKIARLIQYASKLLAYFVDRMKRRELADQLRHLEFHFGTFRKLLRLGKSFEVLYSTLKTLHIPNTLLRSLLTLAKIAQGFFLFFDHIIWFGRVGLMKIDSGKWSRLANRCWLYSITLQLLRDLYEIRMLLQADQHSTQVACLNSFSICSRMPVRLHSMAPHLNKIANLCTDRRDVAVDTIKNLCDLFIPLTYEGHIKLNPGIIGLLGVLSSVAGIIALVDPLARLVP